MSLQGRLTSENSLTAVFVEVGEAAQSGVDFQPPKRERLTSSLLQLIDFFLNDPQHLGDEVPALRGEQNAHEGDRPRGSGTRYAVEDAARSKKTSENDIETQVDALHDLVELCVSFSSDSQDGPQIHRGVRSAGDEEAVDGALRPEGGDKGH